MLTLLARLAALAAPRPRSVYRVLNGSLPGCMLMGYDLGAKNPQELGAVRLRGSREAHAFDEQDRSNGADRHGS